MLNKYVIIHGHFYQPPRETPWTGEIEPQQSALPFHDWNERIAHECYTPNAFSRVLNERGKINHIVNNFKFFSFNFGPTLLSWLEKNTPDTHQKIIDADKYSIDLNNGHGNALAQVYNHVIMPLASDDDKRTQIEWGIKDFIHRFNRYPEGIWLAETAVNQKTINILIEYNIKFIILSPLQAERIRKLDNKTWIDVHTGIIDTKTPYRIFKKTPQGKKIKDSYLDIFFYNATVSSAVGFEHLLTDSVRFADRIQQTFDHWSDIPQATMLATDGESYGHHEKNGDMCFSSFVTRELKNREFDITNCGNFLEISPPKFEVELKKGYNNEGTAWSCAHGVGRWIRNCGCSDGGTYGWNQEWRTPLRKSFDFLNKESNKIYTKKLARYAKDLKKMRNEYIKVVLKKQTKEEFLKNHLKKPCPEKNIPNFFKLLDAQYYCQLTYTSCAWFFADISGLEPMQNLRYAAITIEILSDFLGPQLEIDFLNILDQAKSNIPEKGSGKDLYLTEIKPHMCYPETIVANYAIEDFILKENKDRDIFFYTLHKESNETISDQDGLLLNKGIVKQTNNRTCMHSEYEYFLFVSSYRNMRCYVSEKKIKLNWKNQSNSELEKIISKATKHNFYTLKDLVGADRENIIQVALKKEMKKLETVFYGIYRKNLDLLQTLTQYNLPLPNVLTEISAFALTNKINGEMKKLNKKSSKTKVYQDYKKVRELFLFAKDIGLHIDTSFSEKTFNEIITSKLNYLNTKMNLDLCETIIEFMDIRHELGLELDYFNMQNIVYDILQHDLLSLKPEKNIKRCVMCIQSILKIAKMLSFDVDYFAKESGIDVRSI